MMTFFTRPRPHHGGSHTRTNSPNRPLDEIKQQVEGWGIPADAIERIFTQTNYSGKFNIGRYTKYMEDMMRVNNALGVCSIFTYQALISMEDMAKLYSAKTGNDLSAGELMKAGERIHNLAKLINIKEGFTRNEDKIPETWLRPMETPEGDITLTDYYGTKFLTKIDIEKILDDYYDERGWNLEKGTPTNKKIAELELEEYNRFLF
jgi:aldehyde:ferredoxin oxidoreductase